ncbi:MAG: tripartite tricarboxylate transporter TctB family protein [Kiloniellaceae bacterium]
MRLAELVMAVVMAIFSLYLMWKSTDLPIGWIPDEGPGGGAFSFWLATGMLVCCLAVIARWLTRASAPARSDEPYMSGRTLKQFLLVAGSLTVMIGLIHVIGIYGSVPLFLVFYVRFLGRHPWVTTGAIAAATPVVTFFFFEIALNISLPKGLPVIEEQIFYPLYDIFL